MSWYDYVPFVGPAVQAAQGNYKQAASDFALGPYAKELKDHANGGGYVKEATDALGITKPAPPDLSQGPDAQAIRDYATQLRGEYTNLAPGTHSTIAPSYLDQTASNEARGAATRNLSALEGVASGKTPTAADALLTRGTDQAAGAATGLAAAYSRGNPGAALRAGLAGADGAYAKAASQAAELKANEQAGARSQIGQFADAIRGQDLGAAQFNAGATNDASARNQAAEIQQQQTNNSYKTALGNLAGQESNAPLAAAQANAALQQANNSANQQATGAAWSTIGTAVSDERAKTDVKPRSLADALGREVRGVEYDYKPGMADGGHHVGIIAQDVERAIPGVVSKGPGGMKQVDASQLTMANTSALAELAKRIKAMEARA